MLSAFASSSNVLKVTFLSQRSIEPMYVLCRLHLSASCSCDKELITLKRLMLHARVSCSALLGCRNEATPLVKVPRLALQDDAFESTDYE